MTNVLGKNSNYSDAEAFLFHEARLLDERRFEDWMALFTKTGYYWAPARVEQQDPWNEVSLIFDDREIMTSRIQRLRHPKIYAQLPHSRSVRQISNVQVEKADEKTDDLLVHSTFFMLEHRPTLPHAMERIFAGRITHKLTRANETFQIAYKKVLIANCDTAFDPLFVYF